MVTINTVENLDGSDGLGTRNPRLIKNDVAHFVLQCCPQGSYERPTSALLKASYLSRELFIAGIFAEIGKRVVEFSRCGQSHQASFRHALDEYWSSKRCLIDLPAGTPTAIE